MSGLPSGVVTFVFTDIEGSTPLFERLGEAYRPLQERHRALLRSAWSEHGGHEVGTEGDGFFVAFSDPAAAVRACIEGQRALAAEPWPDDAVIRVRMGVHTGPAEATDGNYTALAVNAAARIMAAGNGGQIVVSEATQVLAEGGDTRFVDVGPQRLRGLSEPVRLYIVAADGLLADERPLRTSRVTTSNLVAPEDDLVGRTQELEELERLVADRRLVTITGTGGVGKTRLAVATAARVGTDFPEGVWFVDLHTLRNDRDVFSALARLVQASDTDDVVASIVQAIGNSAVLIVLDNCEHLLWAAGAIADALVAGCPNARVLVTSREPLGLAAEATWRAPSLPAQNAVELLATRIAAARSRYEPAPAERAALADIAARLGGIPLALELAAARCAAMSPEDVARRLDQRFRLLTGGRGSLSRHQTLEAAVAWSVDLLDDITRAVFRRLAVFVGGWTLDGAEAIASAGYDAFDVDDALHALVSKSLVQVDLEAVPPRYSFLETIRDFAYAELIRADEAGDVHDRHVAYFVQLVEHLDLAIPGPDETSAIERIEAEMENVQTALEWAFSVADLVAAGKLVAHTSDAALTVGRGLQIADWVERVLAALEATPDAVSSRVHAQVLIAAGRVSAQFIHRPKDALPRTQRAWELVRDDPDTPDHEKALALNYLSTFEWRAGDISAAIATRERGLGLLHDRPAMLAVSKCLLAETMLENDVEPAAARAHLHEALALAQRHDTLRPERIARLVLAWDWAMQGNREACEAVLAPLLDLASRTPAVIASAMLGEAARELVSVGSDELAAEFAAASLEHATRAGNAAAVIESSFTAGTVAAAHGDMDAAEREWQLTADLAARHQQPFFAMLSRFRLGWLMEERGELTGVRRLLDEAKPYAFHLGLTPQQSWHCAYGDLELKSGNRKQARDHYQAAVDLARAAPVIAHMAGTVAFLADTCFVEGRYDDAVKLSGLFHRVSTEAALRTQGSVMRYRRHVEREHQLRDMFDEAHHAALSAEGRAWTLDDVAALVDDLTA